MDSKRDIKNKQWLSRWAQVRKRGFLHFWMIYGVLYFVLCFALILVAVNLFSDSIPHIVEFLSNKIVINLLIALGSGLVISVLQWVYNEIRFRRLGSRYPNAVRLF